MRYWVPLLFYASLIIFLSLKPASELPDLAVSDKLIHFLEYLVLGMLLFRFLSRDLKWQGSRLWLSQLLVLVCFATLDEGVQALTPSRYSDAWDGLADISGGIFGAFSYCMIRAAWDRIAAGKKRGSDESLSI